MSKHVTMETTIVLNNANTVFIQLMIDWKENALFHQEILQFENSKIKYSKK